MIKIEQKNIFVFVVCGGIEHIDTLHYSLEALKKFSKIKSSSMKPFWILDKLSA